MVGGFESIGESEDIFVTSFATGMTEMFDRKKAA
jgi:hypothetical protein